MLNHSVAKFKSLKPPGKPRHEAGRLSESSLESNLTIRVDVIPFMTVL